MLYHYATQATKKDKKHLKNVGPIRHSEPPHYHSPGVTSVMSHAARIAIAQAACDSSTCDSSDAW